MDKDTCENVPHTGVVRASSMLQTKSENMEKKISAHVQHSHESEMAPAHLDESQSCVSVSLQEAHLAAVRNHAAVLASNMRQPPPQVGDACQLRGKDGKIVTVPGQDPSYGSMATVCDIGQYSACDSLADGATCSASGVEGVCYTNKKAVGRPDNIVTWIECSFDHMVPGEGETPKPGEPKPPVETPSGVGATASLDATGFKATTALCCAPEMETFFNRLLQSMGLQVCSKPHVQGLMHWFTCVPGMDFQYMIDVINNGNPCRYWSPQGTTCPMLSQQCAGEWCR